MGMGKSLNLLQLEALKKGCQANLRWSISGLPKVQSACAQPLLDLRSRDGSREAFVVERDHIHFRATTGTPGQKRFCASNHQQRLRLNGDPGGFRGHGLLHFAPFVDSGCIPGPNARMLLERRIKSP